MGPVGTVCLIIFLVFLGVTFLGWAALGGTFIGAAALITACVVLLEWLIGRAWAPRQ